MSFYKLSVQFDFRYFLSFTEMKNTPKVEKYIEWSRQHPRAPKFKLNSSLSLATEILTHRNFVKWQYTEVYVTPSSLNENLQMWKFINASVWHFSASRSLCDYSIPIITRLSLHTNIYSNWKFLSFFRKKNLCASLKGLVHAHAMQMPLNSTPPHAQIFFRN